MSCEKRGCDETSCSSAESSSRNYVDPWDMENALYIRGKRISFASDPSTYSAASAIVQDAPTLQDCSSLEQDIDEHPAPDYYELTSENVPSIKYLDICPFCDANEDSAATTAKCESLDSEECSVCSSVAPPPPLLLLSAGMALSAAGLNLFNATCEECERANTPSFQVSSRRRSPERHSNVSEKQRAYVYESPRTRAKLSLPPTWDIAKVSERPRRLSLASQQCCEPLLAAPRHYEPLLALPRQCKPQIEASRQCESLLEPLQHCEPLLAPLMAPPRHPCRWGMGRSGHIAIDYSNAWMSLARRIRPTRS